MKVSELWLRTLINPPLSVAELAEQLTNASIEVDSVEVLEEKQKQAVWTFKIPPNRADCLSMEGIARELSLLNNMPYKPVSVAAPSYHDSVKFPVQIEAPELCPCYYACLVEFQDLSSEQTPDWMKERLEIAGFKVISLVVDVLNYVMLELGQPMHAFDYDKLKGKLIIRKAKPNEELVILGGESIKLNPETLVIADETSAQAMAGVIGGLYSSVTDKTNKVLLESAYFDPIAVRLSGQRYGIKTDGSYRFERGSDPYLPKRALERALELILDSTQGKAKVGSMFSAQKTENIPKNPTILLRKKRIMQLLGIMLEDDEVLNILQRSHQEAKITEEGFLVTAPSYRRDLMIEEDFIEEIGRVVGLHRLKSAMLSGSIDYPSMKAMLPKEKLKQILVDRGYSEVMTYSFVDPAKLSCLNLSDLPLMLKNPISVEMAAMRESLWPGLLQAVHYNQNRQVSSMRFFEMGTCFTVQSGVITEKLYLSGVITGSVVPEQWGVPVKPHDFYDIKGDVEALLAIMNGGKFVFAKTEETKQDLFAFGALHPGQSASILKEGAPIGVIGSLHPLLLKAFDLEGPVALFELDCSALNLQANQKFQALSKYPAIRRDIAIILDQEISVSSVQEAIVECTKELLEKLIIFDIYQGKGISPGQKSVALGLILRHPARTLVETEVNDMIKEVVSILSKRFKATLRD